MENTKKEQEDQIHKEGTEPAYLRGYCRVCNRHYFFKYQMDTGHAQYHQHYGGVCQGCRYICARIKHKTRP